MINALEFTGSYDNPNLPIAASYADRIAALATLRSWWRIDAKAEIDVDGRVYSVPPKAGASPLTLSAGNVPPVWQSNLFGKYPAARMSGGGIASLFSAGGVPVTLTSAYSFVWIGALRNNVAANQYFMTAWGGTDLSAVLAMRLTDQRVFFRHGNGSAFGLVNVANTPSLIIGASTGAQVRILHNAALSAANATNNASAGTNLVVGAVEVGGTSSADCDFAEAMVFQSDILSDTAALALIRNYARTVYGVDT